LVELRFSARGLFWSPARLRRAKSRKSCKFTLARLWLRQQIIYKIYKISAAQRQGDLFPALERREILPQALAVLVGGEVLASVLVELVEELHADLYHLVHRAVLREVAVGKAVLAVFGVVAHDLVAQRHAAALAEALLVGEWVVHSFLSVNLFILLPACGGRNLVNLVNLFRLRR